MWRNATTDRGLFDRTYNATDERQRAWLASESAPPESTRPVSSHVWLEDVEPSSEQPALFRILKVSLGTLAVLLASAAFASMWITPKLATTPSIDVERAPLTDGGEISKLYALQVRSQIMSPVAVPVSKASTNDATSVEPTTPSSAVAPTPPPATPLTTEPAPTAEPPARPEDGQQTSGNPYGADTPPAEPKSDNPY